jgi:hypothetical protein
MRPNPILRKMNLDGDARYDGRFLKFSAHSGSEGATLDRRRWLLVVTIALAMVPMVYPRKSYIYLKKGGVL